MTALALSMLPAGARRPWVAPAINVHTLLLSLAARGGVLPNFAAILQIGVSCSTTPPTCGPQG